jgi:MFS family permease
MNAVGLRLRTLASPLSDPSLRRLWYARLVSEGGDWAARLALGLLVFAQTGSPLATTTVTAVSLLPHLGIGQVLGTLADRFPHRSVMIGAELWRGVIYLVLAFTHLPVPAILALAFVAGLADPPFLAATSAALPLLAGDRYMLVLTLWTSTHQAMTLVGFAAGGLLVAATSPSLALALNAASFLVSIVFIAGSRPTRSSETSERKPLIRPAVRALTSDRLIMVSAGAVTIAAVLGVTVESLMVAYAAHLGYGARGAGLLATIPPIAALLTALLIRSDGAHVQLVRRVCWTVTGMSAVAFTAFILDSPMPVIAVAFLAAGALDVMTVPAGAVIGQRLPQGSRGTAFSFLEGALGTAQVLGALLAGALATAMSVAHASAILALPALAFGVLGLLVIRRPARGEAAARPEAAPAPAVPALPAAPAVPSVAAVPTARAVPVEPGRLPVAAAD